MIMQTGESAGAFRRFACFFKASAPAARCDGRSFVHACSHGPFTQRTPQHGRIVNMNRQECRPLEEYIQSHVETLLKQPRSFIHIPFIDPGSVYDGNVWDWDTFWSVYGLFSVEELFPAEMNERILIHAEGNVRNFIDHQQPDGYIPMMIEVAEWPEPYLVMKHKEGIRMNMHKLFLASQIAMISRKKQDWSWLGPLSQVCPDELPVHARQQCPLSAVGGCCFARSPLQRTAPAAQCRLETCPPDLYRAGCPTAAYRSHRYPHPFPWSESATVPGFPHSCAPVCRCS